ncbi:MULTISPECIES: helix-turn-helix domain-containing protein [unclassified Halorubrum]|uniref:ArsR/SmtB family transcription factor n=1 Tax=unclassified Halorubrum TaxID=2642239 RepID=UPI0003DB881B|nr:MULTISPECIES: helix-turn-helix domain-containing protein [unclassified Halorubrum]CDK38410.1 DNA binding domain-containing protein [Halorubrum sp. AJ67]
MPTAFPYRTPVDHTPHERTNVVVDDDQPSDILQTVSSDTAQQILATLDGEPATTSDIAEAVDTSIQNAKYHIEHLCEANIVEPVDTWYSRKGTEMTVYALSVEEIVVQLGGSISETQP